MENFNNIIAIVILCTASFAHTRQAIIRKAVTSTKTITSPPLPARTDTYQKAADASPAKTYKQLRDDVKIMKADQVINKDGTYTDFFVNFIKSNAQKSHFSASLTQSLLQLGRDVHAQFSGNDTNDLAIIKTNNKQIQNIIDTLKTTPIQQTEVLAQEQSPQNQGIAALQNFRKKSATGSLNDFYLNGKVNELWLKKALELVLHGAPLTTKNKMLMQGELVGNATELMRELLSKNKISSQQWKTMLDDVEKQVISFMNNQPLQDQKQEHPLLKPKESVPQPTFTEPKKPIVEPSKKSEQKTESSIQRLKWISPQNTLVFKEFQIELLRYIFKHQDASEQDIINHFTQQIPKNIPNKNILINGITSAVKDTFKEQEKSMIMPTLPKKTETPQPKAISPEDLPAWISLEDYSLVTPLLKSEVLAYFAHNTDADDNEIADHFKKQIPNNLHNKTIIEKQIDATVKAIFVDN